MIRLLANQHVLFGGLAVITLSLVSMTMIADRSATREPSRHIVIGAPPRITSVSEGGVGIQGWLDYDLFPALSLTPARVVQKKPTSELVSQIITEPPISIEDTTSFRADPILPIPDSITTSEVAWQGTSMSTIVPSLLKAPQDDSIAFHKREAINISNNELSPEEVPAHNNATIGTAHRIAVPSVGIDIGVETGQYDTSTGSWTLSDSSAFHADTTVPVNDSNGTTLIYGHAKWGIFGSLPDTPPGAEATVYATDGSRFVYTLESVRQVDPRDVSMLTSRGAPKLILQTCSGLFDQHRTLAVFHFKEIVEA